MTSNAQTVKTLESMVTANTWRSLAWERNLEITRRFAEQYGSLPSSSIRFEGKEIGQWVRRQQRNFSHLSTGMQEQLENLPGWTTETTRRQDILEANIQAIKEAGGIENVDDTTFVDGHSLTSWLNSQRYRYRTGTMGDEEIKRMESIPDFTWDTQRLRETRNSALVSFVEKQGYLPSWNDVWEGVQVGRHLYALRFSMPQGDEDEDTRPARPVKSRGRGRGRGRS